MNVLTSCAAHTLQKFAEEQEDMPVVFGRALNVTTLPCLLHKVGDIPAGNDPAFLEVPLVPNNDDGSI